MHNKEACIRDRERLLVKRRVKLGRPTPVDRKDIGEVLEKRKKAQNSSDLADSMGALALQEDESDWEDDEEPERGITGKDVRRACANPDCKLLQLKDGTDGQGHVVAMKRCSRCTVVAYCSVRRLHCMSERPSLTRYRSGTVKSQTGRDIKQSPVDHTRSFWRTTGYGMPSESGWEPI